MKGGMNKVIDKTIHYAVEHPEAAVAAASTAVATIGGLGAYVYDNYKQKKLGGQTQQPQISSVIPEQEQEEAETNRIEREPVPEQAEAEADAETPEAEDAEVATDEEDATGDATEEIPPDEEQADADASASASHEDHRGDIGDSGPKWTYPYTEVSRLPELELWALPGGEGAFADRLKPPEIEDPDTELSVDLVNRRLLADRHPATGRKISGKKADQMMWLLLDQNMTRLMDGDRITRDDMEERLDKIDETHRAEFPTDKPPPSGVDPSNILAENAKRGRRGAC